MGYPGRYEFGVKPNLMTWVASFFLSAGCTCFTARRNTQRGKGGSVEAWKRLEPHSIKIMGPFQYILPTSIVEPTTDGHCAGLYGTSQRKNKGHLSATHQPYNKGENCIEHTFLKTVWQDIYHKLLCSKSLLRYTGDLRKPKSKICEYCFFFV
jgi:hypothetical protein